MSDSDINKIARRLFRQIGIPVLVILLAQGGLNVLSQGKKASQEFVQEHYGELYRLNAELSTTLKDYIHADEREKDRIWTEIEKIANRMDMHVYKNAERGGYGKQFTPL